MQLRQYVQLFDSASDVYTLITPPDSKHYHCVYIPLLTIFHGTVRRALTDAPENVAMLIKVITHRLFNLITDHTFPTPQSGAIPKFSSWTSTERNTTKEVLNCLRVIGRVLPVIFESEGSFEDELFWTRPKPIPQDVDVAGGDSEPQFVIEEEDEDEDDGPGNAENNATPKPQKSTTTSKNNAEEQLPTLAERLFDSVIDLLFCCGFTLPTNIQVDHHKINYVIWFALCYFFLVHILT